MKRIAAPTYPKQAHAMVAMMDVAEGNKVLEAGSGSGGLTLFLSRSGMWLFLHVTPTSGGKWVWLKVLVHCV